MFLHPIPASQEANKVFYSSTQWCETVAIGRTAYLSGSWTHREVRIKQCL